mmetsp:Transcript_14978/g.20947  ORF Transcript_14978/g.20947 Transcript_14978/m.20947 type:complete len:91 (-) Transcript_14978:220-492(-)
MNFRNLLQAPRMSRGHKYIYGFSVLAIAIYSFFPVYEFAYLKTNNPEEFERRKLEAQKLWDSAPRREDRVSILEINKKAIELSEQKKQQK